MNIFVLSKKPKLCAAYHCDKHVVKMIIEYTQMLSTTHHHYTGKSLLRPTHRNHPCTLRVMGSIHNYLWLAELALHLSKEYTRRYGKIHALEEAIMQLQSPPLGIPDTGTITNFAVVMPDIYADKNPVKAYRNYYLLDKVRFAQWRYSKRPYRFVTEANS